MRIKELDGIRGIAILLVIVWHYITCLHPPLEPGSLLAYLHLPTTAFWSGVDLFFILSGFLIGGIILDNHTKEGFLKVFWVRRICRICPVLAALLIACLLGHTLLDREQFAWLFDDLMPWWAYPIFMQNIFMGLEGSFGGNFVGVTWSLAIEEQFYMFAPVLILIFGKRRWIQALLPLVVVAVVLRLQYPGFHAYVNTPFRMDSLLMGVWVAVMYRNPKIWDSLSQRKGMLLSLFLILLPITGILLAKGLFGDFKLIWFALLYSTFLTVALLYKDTNLTAFLRSPYLCFWGSIAYGLYMYHQAVAGLLHGWAGNDKPHLNDAEGAILMFVAFLLSTLLAWVSFRTYESFFLKIGKKQRYGEVKGAEVKN